MRLSFLILLTLFYSCIQKQASQVDGNHFPGQNIPNTASPVSNNLNPSAFNEDTQSIITLSYTGTELATACTIPSTSNVTVTQACSCDIGGICTVGVTGAADYNGSASFTYNVTINGVATNTATASLSITSVSDIYSDIAGLKLWLDFGDSTKIFSDATCTTAINTAQAVACIKDKSTTADSFTQATVARRPVFQGSYVEFTRASVHYLASAASYSTPNVRTFVILVEPYNTSIYNTYIINTSAAGGLSNFFHVYSSTSICINPAAGLACDIDLGAPTINTGHLVYAVKNLTTSKIRGYLNGVLTSPEIANAVAITNEPLRVGGITNASQSLGGRLYEILMYDVDLTDAQRERVEGMMACKWNKQSLLPAAHPYKTFCLD